MRTQSGIAPRRRKARRLATSSTPHDAVILAVDTASRSGWAIWVRGQLDSSGAIGITDSRGLVAICERVQPLAIDCGLRAKDNALVLERSWGGNSGAREALGAARFAWERAWCEAWGTSTPRRVVRVYPATWRAALFGTTKGTLPMERRRALQYVSDNHEPGEDECAAICIGRWAVQAGEVGVVLPKARGVL